MTSNKRTEPERRAWLERLRAATERVATDLASEDSPALARLRKDVEGLGQRLTDELAEPATEEEES